MQGRVPGKGFRSWGKFLPHPVALPPAWGRGEARAEGEKGRGAAAGPPFSVD